MTNIDESSLNWVDDCLDMLFGMKYSVSLILLVDTGW